MSGDSELLAMIATLKKVGGPDVARQIATAGAPFVEQALKATAAAGTSPTGEAWAPRKDDGGRAMADAAEHVTAKAAGERVRATVSGPDAFHHYGVRGEPRRLVVPDGPSIPPVVAEAMLKGANQVFDRIVGST